MGSWKDAQVAYTVKIYDKPGELGGYEWTYDRTTWGNAELMARHFFGKLLFAVNVLAWYVRDDEPDVSGRLAWRRCGTGLTPSPTGLYAHWFMRDVLEPHIAQRVAASSTAGERLRWEQWRLTSGNVPALNATIANLKRLPGMVGMVAQDECRLGGWRDRKW